MFENHSNMSHTGKKRVTDSREESRGQFLKKAKHGAGGSSSFGMVPQLAEQVSKPNSNNSTSSNDPLEKFYQSLIKCRSVFSAMDKKKIVSRVPDLLNKLLAEARAVSAGKMDLAQFMTALNELRGFQARALQSDYNLLRLTTLLDNCFYTLHYCLDLHRRTSANQRTKTFIAAPHTYFINTILSIEDAAVQNNILKEYIDRSISAKGRAALERIWGSLLTQCSASSSNSTANANASATHKSKNPLLDLHFARWRESVCLLTALALIPEVSQVSQLIASCRPQVLDDPTHATMKGADPLLPPFLRQWNDGCRIWPCHLYSFATPTTEALAKICSFSPVTEIGAGTGYWAHMLRTFSPTTQVIAYDKDPCSAQGKVIKPNDYHGGSKAWTNVLKGGPEVAANHTAGCLFLCYPPPDNAMGLLALRAYKGSTVCYVGEWQGDTGTKGFEKLLAAEFRCEEIMPLPNWGDTCYSLTVWQRRSTNTNSSTSNSRGNKGSGNSSISSGKKSVGVSGKAGASAAVPVVVEHLLPHRTHPFRCTHCGTGRTEAAAGNNSVVSGTGDTSSGGAVRQLFRCRLTYNVYFCSEQCAVAGRDAQLDELAVKSLLQARSASVGSAADSADCVLPLTAAHYVKVPAPCIE